MGVTWLVVRRNLRKVQQRFAPIAKIDRHVATFSLVYSCNRSSGHVIGRTASQFKRVRLYIEQCGCNAECRVIKERNATIRVLEAA